MEDGLPLLGAAVRDVRFREDVASFELKANRPAPPAGQLNSCEVPPITFQATISPTCQGFAMCANSRDQLRDPAPEFHAGGVARSSHDVHDEMFEESEPFGSGCHPMKVLIEMHEVEFHLAPVQRLRPNRTALNVDKERLLAACSGGEDDIARMGVRVEEPGISRLQELRQKDGCEFAYLSISRLCVGLIHALVPALMERSGVGDQFDQQAFPTGTAGDADGNRPGNGGAAPMCADQSTKFTYRRRAVEPRCDGAGQAAPLKDFHDDGMV